MTKKIFTRSLLNSLGVVAYVALIATFMNHANTWLGEKDTAFTPVIVLMLFTLSAAVVGSLTFGYPVLMFLNGQKREAVTAAIMTIGCLAVETLLIITVVAIFY